MILYKTEAVKVEFDSAIPAVIWRPVQFMSSAEFRKPFEVGIDFYIDKFQQIPGLGWLNDTRLLKPVKPSDVHWLDKNVNDRVYSLGDQRIAFVLPESIFGKMAIKMYMNFTKLQRSRVLKVEAFETIGEAKLWIKGISLTKPVF